VMVSYRTRIVMVLLLMMPPSVLNEGIFQVIFLGPAVFNR